MLRPRIIPCLLVHRGALIKTVGFGASKYIGDPINAVKIFNEKGVDELVVLDIDASVNGVQPDFALISNLASECRMPLCYGGGIKNVEQAKKIIGLGVEKIAISSAFIDNPSIVAQISNEIGKQSVAIVLDVKKRDREIQYDVFIKNGLVKTGLSVYQAVYDAQKLGAGELIINSIDRDGSMCGYDLVLAKIIKEISSVPVTILGGAGNLEHIQDLVRTCGIVGASAGSLFVFKGIYKAVLINYPTLIKRDAMFKNELE
jgi:cyclase